ncbi:hypothetical protein MXD81_31440 [Microbacteriaceae bacterium K1510]|nr:hypothetical protein [Microbacteriaceae bacterium K1510]
MEDDVGHGHGNWRSYRSDRQIDRGTESDYEHMGDRPPQLRTPVSWLAILVGFVVWSGVVYAGYLALDLVLSWLAANSGTVLQSSKDAGDTLGVGKQVGVAVERLKSAGVVDQGLALLRTILMPVAFVIWALGAAAIVLLPQLMGQISGGFLTRRH